MKTPILPLLWVSFACSQSVDFEAEKSAITKLIDDETRFAAAVDTASWAKCWTKSDEATFTIATSQGMEHLRGWRDVRSLVNAAKPFDLELSRDQYQYTIGNDVAFVSFSQRDNWGGGEQRQTRESRTLRKINGEWKITDVSVIGVSTYNKSKQASFHTVKENLPVGMKAPKTIMRSKTGLGGMAVAFNEVPAGGDMTALFQGLPENACPAPHWGYILEGSVRIKYVDGRDETVNAGEVFYWPAGHIPFVEKDLKIIDFSPEAEFNQVMEHLGKKMAEQK